MIAGVYTTSFVANDTLPAKLDSIRLALNGSYVESTTSLKRGAAYTFIPQAEDNYQTSAQLRYQYRVSFDGGLNFVNNWTQSEEFTLQVPSYASNLVLKVRVTDASANAIEKNFNVVTVPASVQLSSNPQFPAFFTNPEWVEELNPSEIGFHLVGDLELIKTAEIKVFDDGVWQPALVDSSTGKTSIQFNQPRLSDLNDKSKTTIEDGAFIGSNSALVAPVTVGKNATVGAGSIVTKNSEEGDLIIARAKQSNIKGWARPVKK